MPNNEPTHQWARQHCRSPIFLGFPKVLFGSSYTTPLRELTGGFSEVAHVLTQLDFGDYGARSPIGEARKQGNKNGEQEMNIDRVEMLRIAQVKKIIGLSRSTIYSLISQGSFPRQVHLGPKAVAWISSEIQTWVAARITQSRGVKEEVSQ